MKPAPIGLFQILSNYFFQRQVKFQENIDAEGEILVGRNQERLFPSLLNDTFCGRGTNASVPISLLPTERRGYRRIGV